MKKIKRITTILSTVCALSFAGFLGGCGETAQTSTYVYMAINPQIEMMADEEGNVLTLGALNTDGEVVLAEMELAD